MKTGFVMKNRIFHLSEDIVRTYGLPTNVVDFTYVRLLANMDLVQTNGIKVAPHLTPEACNPTHYGKMKVSLALRVSVYFARIAMYVGPPYKRTSLSARHL